jgi:hypothetical protein
VNGAAPASVFRERRLNRKLRGFIENRIDARAAGGTITTIDGSATVPFSEADIADLIVTHDLGVASG